MLESIKDFQILQRKKNELPTANYFINFSYKKKPNPICQKSELRTIRVHIIGILIINPKKKRKKNRSPL